VAVVVVVVVVVVVQYCMCRTGQYCLIYGQGLPVSEVLLRLHIASILNFTRNLKTAAGSNHRLFS